MPAGASDKMNGDTAMMLDNQRYVKVEPPFHVPTPLAFAGAFLRHAEHNFDEHGISCLRYSSLTIFWTLPFLVDLTKTLLEILEAFGSACSCRFRLVMSYLFSWFSLCTCVANQYVFDSRSRTS